MNDNENEIAISSSKRKKFTPEEDAILKQECGNTDHINWDIIAKKLAGRTATQCRDRYTNYLYKAISNDKWTLEEDMVILEKTALIGHKWVTIAQYLPGRSGNNVKNRWHKYLSVQSHRQKVKNQFRIKQSEKTKAKESVKNNKKLDIETEIITLNENDFPVFHFLE